MRELALKHKDSHLDISPLVYGSKPSNPLTWDADMLHSCKSDDYGYSKGTLNNITSYVGDETSERECPYGFNPRDNEIISFNKTTTHSYKFILEIQQLLCVASSGYFTLSFRGAISAPISANSTALALENILQDMPTIGQVKVQLSSNTSTADVICSTAEKSGNVYMAYTNITFVTQLGYTPLLLVASSHLSGGIAQATVSRVQAGQGTLKECSGKGLCNRQTGLCECFDGYGSGDGRGHIGTRGECSHLLEI